jgi:RNA polymerase sigma-70 factor (ECF subfamily)
VRKTHDRHRLTSVSAEAKLVERLRSGDEEAFVAVVSRHHQSMLRLARTFVSSDAVAEEVVQDTWLGVLRGIDRFDGRASLRTWLLAILVNRARSSGEREGRSVAVGDVEAPTGGPRFNASGAWVTPPTHWAEEVEERLSAAALAGPLREALAQLPARQLAVVTLRDIEGLRSDEVCDVLSLSEANQRVLLHRGRSHLREALETRLGAP